MQRGEEREVSAVVKKVFDEFVAPDYTFKGRTTFIRFINPAAIYSRNFRGDSFTILCKDGHRIVAVLEVQRWTHVLLLFVDGDYHGRGIAKGLLTSVMEMCRDKGTSAITVSASPYGEPFYRKMGFTAVEPQKVRDGIKFTPMEKVL